MLPRTNISCGIGGLRMVGCGDVPIGGASVRESNSCAAGVGCLSTLRGSGLGGLLELGCGIVGLVWCAGAIWMDVSLEGSSYWEAKDWLSSMRLDREEVVGEGPGVWALGGHRRGVEVQAGGTRCLFAVDVPVWGLSGLRAEVRPSFINGVRLSGRGAAVVRCRERTLEGGGGGWFEAVSQRLFVWM